MDIEFFLKNRTKFMRYFYEHASLPFTEIISAIEREDEPFVPPYSEDPEPPFLEEWQEATTGTEAVGHSVLSMLASSLRLFLKEWVYRLEQDHKMTFERNFKKKGWFNGYMKIFGKLELPLDECPANFLIIEQVALARNRAQHPEEITDLTIRHSKNDLKKHPHPFFAQESEIAMATLDDDNVVSWCLPPSISSTKAKIFEAIAEVESLCAWLESEYWEARKA